MLTCEIGSCVISSEYNEKYSHRLYECDDCDRLPSFPFIGKAAMLMR